MGRKRGIYYFKFLLKAAFISTAGGQLGTLIGFIIPTISNRFFNDCVTPLSAIVGFVVAVSIGIFFGVYPV